MNPGVLSDLLWPRLCEACDGPVDRPDRMICSRCLMRLPVIGQAGCCRICGRSIAGQREEFLCDDCRGKYAPAFDRACSALEFDGTARRMILDFKFNRHIWMVPDFVDFIEAAAMARFDIPAVDAVLPVPATLLRRLVRGYNQCDFLAKGLAKRIGRHFEPSALRRKNSPLRQGGLNEEERRENIVGTFEAVRPERLRGRTLLVVDDIMTTGSTLSECAKTLKAAGADRVWCVTLARSLRT